MSKLDALQTLLSNDLRLFRNPFVKGMEATTRSAGPAAGNRRWRVPSLDFFDSFRISGILGGRKPSLYSESPDLWNPYFRELGVEGVFFTFDLPVPRKLRLFLKRWLAVPGALDLTVTDPFKHAVYLALKSLPLPVRSSEQVERSRSVNHLILDEDSRCILALNTDGLGMVRALLGRVELEGRRILLLGAGGSAASIAAALVSCRCHLWIANRTASRAEALAESLRRSVSADGEAAEIVWSGFERIGEVLPKTDVLINTVSAGCPIDVFHAALLPAWAVLAESKYGEKADLGQLAGDRIYVDGRGMLFGQFAEAAQIVAAVLGVADLAHSRAVDSVRPQ